MRIMVLGGAGKMGCLAVQDLANDRRVEEVVLADVNLEQAKLVAETINSSKISLRQVDLRDQEGFESELRGMGACINATVYYTNVQVMQACLQAGVAYLDLGGLFHVTRQQLRLGENFKSAGVSAVLGMGTAPGITNVQARYGADRLERVESIKIYDGSRRVRPAGDRFTYAIPTIIDELTLEPVVFQNGEFVSCPPLSGMEDYWFTPPIGMKTVHLSLHSEVATLPLNYGAKGLQECFFKINYWGMSPEMVAKVQVLADFGFGGREPVQVKGQAVVPYDLMLALLGDKVPPITEYLAPPLVSPPDWTQEMATEVRGQQGGQELLYQVRTLTCKSALPTGVAPAIAAIWLAEGRIPPGVHAPESAIDPEPFFAELKQRGIVTQVSVTEML